MEPENILITKDRARIEELENAIKEVVSATYDDLCWMDVFTKLANLVGIAFDPKMLSREHMLTNCGRFVDSMLAGSSYEPVNMRKAFSTWLEILDANGLGMPSSADVGHSALLQRLLSGKPALPSPPPLAFSYPWYGLIENGRDEKCEAWIFEEHPDGPRAVINQHTWEIVERVSGDEFVITHDRVTGNYRVSRMPDEKPPFCWLIEKINAIRDQQ